ASNKRNRPAGADLVAIGELGLSGEVRRVSQLERRLLESHRLGFKRAVIPAAAELRDPELSAMTLYRAETISDALDSCFWLEPKAARASQQDCGTWPMDSAPKSSVGAQFSCFN